MGHYQVGVALDAHEHDAGDGASIGKLYNAEPLIMERGFHLKNVKWFRLVRL